MIKENNDSDTLTIPLDLVGCMIHYRHRLPTTEEVVIQKQRNTSTFSDQVADKFHQQVIETGN
jgi:hypothetical protein